MYVYIVDYISQIIKIIFFDIYKWEIKKKKMGILPDTDPQYRQVLNFNESDVTIVNLCCL